jgi:E3 ubiquitin-protein ligase HUWE1
MVSTFYLMKLLVLTLRAERNDDQSLHTILVWAFYKQGGLAPLLAIGDRFIATIERIGKVGAGEQTDTSKEQLVCSYAGMKVLLHLLQPLVSSRLIFEASQTILLSTNGKKEGEKGYFNAHEFLVQLRTAILPFTRKVWESQWLLEAPQGVIKSVAHIVLELVKAENEEVKEGGPQVPTVAPQAFVLDETRVTAITDMGFSRSAARRALTRGRNNVAAATEMLISQPYLFPELPDEPDEPEVNQEMRAASDDDEAAPVAVAEVAEEVKDETPVKTLEQWRAELKSLREPLQEDVGRFALRIVDAHPGLIFEVQALFIGSLGSPQEPSIRRLIEDIKTFSPAAYDVQEQPMAVRCRLLALTLSHPGSQDIVKKDAKTLMDSLLALLLSKPVQTDVEHQPKWLAAHLLVAEALLMLGEQPRGITLPAEGEPIEPQTLHDGSLYPEARGVLFNTCMKLVTIPMLMPAELLSSLRMLVLLTREHKYAMDFVKRGGPTSLMACLRQGERENDLAIKSHIIIIIRHVVEDHKTLQGIMQHAFKRFFQNPKTRTPDVANFVRGCSAVALRDPAAFVEAASAVATLSRPYGAPQYVKLKTSQEAEAKPASADETKASEVAMQIDVSLSHVEALEPLVHGIIKEVFSSTKAVFDGHSSTETSLSKAETDAPLGDVPIPLAETNVLSTQESKTSDPKAEQAYASYALQALTELLFSYDSCKLAFLAYSDKKRTQTPSKEKSRSTALHYILYDLINADSIEPKSSSASDPKANVTNWAMSVIVALCVDTSHVPDMKDLSADVISVRKVVLDGLSRAFKDASAISSIQTRYGRLMVLSDLVHRLLIVRPHYTTKKTVEDTPTHLAKLMLEKNYVATLTNALGDVDLNYPQVKHLVTAILKPLELL